MRVLDEAIVTKLKADNGAGGFTTLSSQGIHKVLAPQDVPPPFSTIQCVSSPDEYTFRQRASVTLSYLFKAYAADYDWNTTQNIVERADVVLTDATYSVTGFNVLRARRANGFDTQEEIEGINYAVSVVYFTFQVTPS